MPSGTFSMVKISTQKVVRFPRPPPSALFPACPPLNFFGGAQQKLVAMVKPFSMPFGTDVQAIEAEREADHDPAGMHKKLRESLESLPKKQEDSMEQVEDGRESGAGAEIKEEEGGERDGDDLATEVCVSFLGPDPQHCPHCC